MPKLVGADPEGSVNYAERFGFSFIYHGWRWDLMAFKQGSDVANWNFRKAPQVARPGKVGRGLGSGSLLWW